MVTSFMQPMSLLNLLLILLRCLSLSQAYSIRSQSTRQEVFQHLTKSLAATVGLASLTASKRPALAAETDGAKIGITDEQLKEIIRSDVVDRQFLATANLTPSVYRASATFTDEIDTYAMDQWIRGTRKLFVGEKSNVRLVGDIDVSPEKVEFRFDEDLCFNIPFKPVVALSGRVLLERDASGYIISYREFWDQDVATVLKTAKFK